MFTILNQFSTLTVDIVLPCARCLAIANGLPSDRWGEAVMEAKHLNSQMQTRLRQHLARKHGLKTRDVDAKKIRELGKQLLCPILHSKKHNDLSAEVSITLTSLSFAW